MKLREGSQQHGMLQLLSHVRDKNPVTRSVARSVASNPDLRAFANGWHPGDARTVMSQYRRHILSCKRSWGTARGLVNYRAFIESYRAAKREVLARL